MTLGGHFRAHSADIKDFQFPLSGEIKYFQAEYLSSVQLKLEIEYKSHFVLCTEDSLDETTGMASTTTGGGGDEATVASLFG